MPALYQELPNTAKRFPGNGGWVPVLGRLKPSQGGTLSDSKLGEGTCWLEAAPHTAAAGETTSVCWLCAVGRDYVAGSVVESGTAGLVFE